MNNYGASPAETVKDRPTMLVVFLDEAARHCIGRYDGWLKAAAQPGVNDPKKTGGPARRAFVEVVEHSKV